MNKDIEFDTQPSWWQKIRYKICFFFSPPNTKKDVEKLYNQLLTEVASKFPGESRHETALRYIRSQEHGQTRVGTVKDGTAKEPSHDQR